MTPVCSDPDHASRLGQPGADSLDGVDVQPPDLAPPVWAPSGYVCEACGAARVAVDNGS